MLENRYLKRNKEILAHKFSNLHSSWQRAFSSLQARPGQRQEGFRVTADPSDREALLLKRCRHRSDMFRYQKKGCERQKGGPGTSDGEPLDGKRQWDCSEGGRSPQRPIKSSTPVLLPPPGSQRAGNPPTHQTGDRRRRRNHGGRWDP